MQRFIFTDDLDGKNSPGSKTIELKHVLEVTGLNGMPVTLNSTNPYGKDGIVVSSITMDARPFSIQFDILGKNFEEAAEERRALTAFFGNKKPKRFEYTRDGFTVYLKDVYLAGVYETGASENRILNGTMQFIATNPYFRKDIDLSKRDFEKALLMYPEEGIVYDSVFDEDKNEYYEVGIEYSTIETSISVENNGDEVSPALIRFYGPAQNPKITNKITDQSMKVAKKIEDGEILEISTEKARIDIIHPDETRSNAFSYIEDDSDTRSEFINLAVGENVFEFVASGGDTGYLEVGGVEYYAGI